MIRNSVLDLMTVFVIETARVNRREFEAPPRSIEPLGSTIYNDMHMNQPYVRSLICVSPRTCWRTHRFSLGATESRMQLTGRLLGCLAGWLAGRTAPARRSLADLTLRALEGRPFENAPLSSEEIVGAPLVIPSVI